MSVPVCPSPPSLPQPAGSACPPPLQQRSLRLSPLPHAARTRPARTARVGAPGAPGAPGARPCGSMEPGVWGPCPGRLCCCPVNDLCKHQVLVWERLTKRVSWSFQIVQIAFLACSPRRPRLAAVCCRAPRRSKLGDRAVYTAPFYYSFCFLHGAGQPMAGGDAQFCRQQRTLWPRWQPLTFSASRRLCRGAKQEART